MNYRKPFYVFPYKGKKTTIWHYKAYNEYGKLKGDWSTGKTTKKAAEAYCLSLYKKSKLIPKLKSKQQRFMDIFKDWFIWDKCRFIQKKLERGKNYSKNYAYIQRINLNKHIIPYFGNKKLDDISPNMVDNWLFSFKNKGISNSTANHLLQTLKTMLTEVCKQGYIASSPAFNIEPLKRFSKEKGILKPNEVKRLFPENYKTNWNNYIVYTGNILAASTGMRRGEILALRDTDVKDNYIEIQYSWDHINKNLKETKTRKKRYIPIPNRVEKLIIEIIDMHSGFIFSWDGNKPIHENCLNEALYTALNKIGISEDERKKRNISFHSWRHFFNSYLRSNGIVDAKTQRITGHTTKEMLERYTHFDIDDFSDVKIIQEGLF